MNKDFQKRVAAIKKKWPPEELRIQIRQLEAQAAKPDFWQDQQKASAQMKELAQKKEELTSLEKLDEWLAGGQEKELAGALKAWELKTFFHGPHDDQEALLSVHAGQGGVEAQDWAQMLQRMYQKYCEKKDWPYQLVQETPAEEAGIKSVTLWIKAPYAYGCLRREAGTHRLVRQSPFNADHLRQTSFALVEVLPRLEETAMAVIKDEDLTWQFFRASTQGGQNVQKVSSAVRLIHKPTGIVVTAQAERYQERNRQLALTLLRGKLWQQAESQAKAQKEALKKGRKQASWGTQIRSYVLHPYKMVKDLRTNLKTEDPEAVLNGELEAFVEAEIRQLP